MNEQGRSPAVAAALAVSLGSEQFSTHHAVQTAQDLIKLPAWTDPPEEVSKDRRLLQHIALRVSLEDGRDLPWSHAARAVEAWDAELFLAKGATDAQAQGLKSFSDEMVFLHLTMAFLADECVVPLLLPPTTIVDGAATGAPAAPLSGCVFDAGHSWPSAGRPRSGGQQEERLAHAALFGLRLVLPYSGL
ncbi:unnamed protein product [Effrenium voratum]|nr:unnamed protein product [Effrenium voratum]